MTCPVITDEPIDLKPQLDAIRRCFHEYWRNDHADEAAQALWGGPFGPREEERIALGHLWRAEVRLAPAPNGTWAISLMYEYGIGGSYAPISPWSRYAYPSRAAALEAGLDALINKYADIQRRPHLLSEGQRVMAGRMIEALRTLQASSRQLSLL